MTTQEIVTQVLPHLPGWHITSQEPDWVTLRHTENPAYGLLIRPQWNQPTRLRIQGLYPHTTYQDEPEITLRATHSPQVIAREITRRFLPRYFPLADQMIQRAAVEAAAHDRAVASVEALAAAMGAHCRHVVAHRSPRDYLAHLTAGSVFGSFRHTYHAQFTIQLTAVPLELALQMVRLIREYADGLPPEAD